MKRKGFTLLELLISMTIFTIIIGAVTTVFFNSQRSKQKVDQLIQTQQAARTAIDYMIKDLRAAGYNIDIEEATTSTPQRRIVYASSYEVIFNANIMPAEDSPDSPLEPSAMKVSASERPAHYYPTVKYNTGAETVVFTLDWDNDGLINANDRDLSPASLTDNPNDYCLIKRVYGEWDNGTNIDTLVEGVEGWTNQEVISIVAGPDRFPSQNTGIPMFGYLIDNDGDPTTLPELYGDTDGDGIFSEDEAKSLAPITDLGVLEKIEMIRVMVTGVSQSSYKGNYIQASILSDVSVMRNASTKVYLAKGHVYEDADADGIFENDAGIPNVKVKLSTGEMAITDENGIFTFAIVPGTYGVSVSPEVSWRATTAVNFEFVLTNDMIDFTQEDEYKNYFGMEQTPTGIARGIAFLDADGDGLWDKDDGENGILGIQLATWNNETVTTEDPDYFGFYSLPINAGETLTVWATVPFSMESLASSGVDTNDILNLGTSSFTPIPLTISMAKMYVEENETAYVSFGFLNAVGNRPSITVLHPNGGEIYTSGSIINIKTFANSNDLSELIKRIVYYYSMNGGYDWIYIGEENYPTADYPPDTFIYEWTVPDSIQGSQSCLIKAEAIDEGNWTVFDISDNYFTIIPKGGYNNLYFTYEYIDSLKDDSLYIYSFHYSAAGLTSPLPFPRYLAPANQIVEGIIADSLPWTNKSTTYTGRRFYTQMGDFAEFITPKGVPHTDSIFPGQWNFFVWGSTTAPNNETEFKHYDFEVYLCDSTGSLTSRILLFSTLQPSTYSDLNYTYIGNNDALDTVSVTVNQGWETDPSDRILVKTFYSGTFSSPKGAGNEKLSPRIYLNFGGSHYTRMQLPPAQ